MTSEEQPCAVTPIPSAEKAVQWRPCANPGNPVFSCMLEPAFLTTSNFLTKPKPLLFKTTSSDYGAIPPTSQMVPCYYFPKNNAFTTHLFHCGLTQNNCLNTGIDRDSMYDYTGLM